MKRSDADIRLPRRPLWVAIGLWGLPTRASAVAFFWLSIVSMVASIFAFFWHPIFLLGVLLMFAALWYWLAIRWVDQNGGWGQ